MRTKSYKKYLFLILVLFFLFIAPSDVKAFSDKEIYCFGWDDCSGWNCSTRTLICYDDRPGYNVECNRLGVERCAVYDGCPLGIIETCDYIPIRCDQMDCGSDYWDGYRCFGTTLYAKYVDNGCSDGVCYTHVIWYPWIECGSDYWGDYSCSGTMQIRQYVSRGCSVNYCYTNYSWENWADCGGDYWGDSYTCSGTMQQRLYVSEGCSGSSCNYLIKNDV